jgi:2-(1,2-epoxy-1,2-dihydrophenyl)acetyl-CoA isomerase
LHLVRSCPSTYVDDVSLSTSIDEGGPALNAWTREVGAELLAAVPEAAADPGVRTGRITGAGRAFAAGADLRDMGADDARTAEGHPDLQRLLTERYDPIITLVREMEKPVLAAVNGPAAGIGASRALACDLALARESAYLLLVREHRPRPGRRILALVPSRVRFARAAEMAILGERVQPRAPSSGG